MLRVRNPTAQPLQLQSQPPPMQPPPRLPGAHGTMNGPMPRQHVIAQASPGMVPAGTGTKTTPFSPRIPTQHPTLHPPQPRPRAEMPQSTHLPRGPMEGVGLVNRAPAPASRYPANNVQSLPFAVRLPMSEFQMMQQMQQRTLPSANPVAPTSLLEHQQQQRHQPQQRPRQLPPQSSNNPSSVMQVKPKSQMLSPGHLEQNSPLDES